MSITKVLVGSVLVAASATSNASTRLLVNCFFPPQHFVCAEVLPTWKEAVEQATDGRVKIRFPASSMAPPPEQLASVRSGIFDAAVQFNGFIANEAPGSLVAMMPFAGTNDAEVNSLAFWRTYEKFFSKSNEYADAKLLGLFAAPGADFYSTTDQPINNLSDAIDRKMWALPGATAEVLKSSGGSVVSGPAVQMTEIIQRGVVDGFVGIPTSDARAFNVLPYAKSVTRTSRKIFAPSFSFVINERKWSELDEKDRQAIMAVSGEQFARQAGQAWNRAEQGAIDSIASDVAVNIATKQFEADLLEASSGISNKWSARMAEAGLAGEQALNYYIEQTNELIAD